MMGIRNLLVLTMIAWAHAGSHSMHGVGYVAMDEGDVMASHQSTKPVRVVVQDNRPPRALIGHEMMGFMGSCMQDHAWHRQSMR